MKPDGWRLYFKGYVVLRRDPMKPQGIRDIIGPIMVGPSSSHTAGALRIASMARSLLAGEPVHVKFTLYG